MSERPRKPQGPIGLLVEVVDSIKEDPILVYLSAGTQMQPGWAE